MHWGWVCEGWKRGRTPGRPSRWPTRGSTLETWLRPRTSGWARPWGPYRRVRVGKVPAGRGSLGRGWGCRTPSVLQGALEGEGSPPPPRGPRGPMGHRGAPAAPILGPPDPPVGNFPPSRSPAVAEPQRRTHCGEGGWGGVGYRDLRSRSRFPVAIVTPPRSPPNAAFIAKREPISEGAGRSSANRDGGAGLWGTGCGQAGSPGRCPPTQRPRARCPHPRVPIRVSPSRMSHNGWPYTAGVPLPALPGCPRTECPFAVGVPVSVVPIASDPSPSVPFPCVPVTSIFRPRLPTPGAPMQCLCVTPPHASAPWPLCLSPGLSVTQMGNVGTSCCPGGPPQGVRLAWMRVGTSRGHGGDGVGLGTGHGSHHCLSSMSVTGQHRWQCSRARRIHLMRSCKDGDREMGRGMM